MTVASSPVLSAAAASLDRRTRMLRTAMGPLIAAALDDPDVVEVMLNPDGLLWLDRLSVGRARLGTLAAGDGERIIRLVAAHVGQEVHRNKPLLSAELPETGERFEGVLPPVVAGPTFALRKRAAGVIPLQQYVADGILSAAQAEHLRVAVRERQNILVAGGTSSGKTTLANALLAEVAGSGDRVLVLEDTVELQCPITSLCAPSPAWSPWQIWCAARCACAPIEWWSARFAAARRWIWSRPGAPAIPAVSPPFMPALHRAHCCAWSN